MPVFHQEAIRMGATGRALDWVQPEHVADWSGLGTALDRISPEQRCDAIYVDWLLQLNSPSQQALLQVRNLLIGRGAIAANYLAELAQNADDASDGKEALIRIVVDQDWLLVSNNGRKVTSLNLLGLCRFFVHSGGRIVDLGDEQTIGRFGIGFKSCYRIASEVFVFTWDPQGSYAFRLPICRDGDSSSAPDPARFERLLARIQSAGVGELDSHLRELRSLGYCTPEFLSQLPANLASSTEPLRQTARGTMFCFHVRADRLDEVRRRISGQSHEVYELCPLFLPNLTLVRLGPNELELRTGHRNEANSLAGLVEADRITLTTRSPATRQSHSRFWRLRGVADGDLWQIALHADHEHRLRIEREDDEQGLTLKDGAAYAFFPLNAQSWPFRLHLHIKLSTNLARDNWNQDDSPAVQEQIRRAVAGMAAWLEHQTDKWHPKWNFESLISRRPNQNEGWAWEFWKQLDIVQRERPLHRGIGTGFVDGRNAKAICIVEHEEAHKAWEIVISRIPSEKRPYHLLATESEAGFEINEISANEAVGLCQAAVGACPEDSEVHRAALTAFLGCHNLMLHRNPQVIGSLIGSIQCNLKNGEQTSLSELFDRPGGAELTEAWHQAFGRIHGWAREVSWANESVRGRPLQEQLGKLSKPEFNPTWQEIPTSLADEAAWRQHGDDFWRKERGQCPRACAESVLLALRVPSPNRTWLPMADLWLDDDSPVDCFGGLLTSWPIPQKDPTRRGITASMRQWGLFDVWDRRARQRVRENLPGVLTRCLLEQSEKDAFSLVFGRSFQAAHRQLEDDWRAVVGEAQKNAVSRFIGGRQAEAQLTGKCLLSQDIPADVRSALTLLPDFHNAPSWLSEAAHRHIRRLGLQDNCRFTYLSQEDWSSRKVELVRQLLERFHTWCNTPISEHQIKGLQDLVADVSPAQRKDWIIGLSPQKRRSVRVLLLPAPSSTQASARDRLMGRLLTQAEWVGEPLPPLLMRVPAVAEACVPMDKLELDAPFGPLTPLDPDQLAPSLREDPDLKSVLEDPRYQVFGSPSEINLRWRYDGEAVATLNDADFALVDNRLVVHRFGAPADEEQCRRILAAFETHATPSAEYRADTTMSPFEKYQRYRDLIRQTLVSELVVEQGYRKQHVLRELLQNAESAYASKAGQSGDAWFEFSVEECGIAGRRRVIAKHAGRAFNETDAHNKPRQDVERIWRLAARSERMPDEVGRFNRGFKTVFTVACDGLVHICSGAYDFEVIDLLLLRPADPKPKLQPPSATTAFTFDVPISDSLEMVQLKRLPHSSDTLVVLNASSFVFLRHLARITVKFEYGQWSWLLWRRPGIDGWDHLSVQTPSGEAEDFIVFHGRKPPTATVPEGPRFSAAIRVHPNGLPKSLESAWRVFRLTFETDRKFPLDFLVNGDFAADQGRVTIQNIVQSGLIEAAYESVIKRAQAEIRLLKTKEAWIAWAKALHLADAIKELEGALQTGVAPFRQLGQVAIVFFTENIPHAGQLTPLTQLEIPSRLLRRLGDKFASNWGLRVERWMAPEIVELLPDVGQSRLSLHRWLSDITPMEPVLHAIKRDFEQFQKSRPALSQVEQDELEEAKRILAEKLRPVVPPTEEPVEEPIRVWSVRNLWTWWEREGRPVDDYTLDGSNWPLLYPGDQTAQAARRQKLQGDLTHPETDQGRRIWYRVLSLACMMSARGRMATMRGFWSKRLEAQGFWQLTSERCDFGERTREFFSRLVLREHSDAAASGEWAEYWRRVFYDVRKIHELVWQHDFADTVLRLATDPGRASELPQFLRSGQLGGQQPWAGVLGQSAGAPLFFLVRELTRLGLAKSQDVQRLSFFCCTPVRRAAASIGWIGQDLADKNEFESLARISERIHDRFASDPQIGSRFLSQLFDIPLLHMGVTSPVLPPFNPDID